jgi:preprotein translocase subunit SecG
MRREKLPMRLIGIVIALGLMMWVLFYSSGGNESEGVIPASYMESLEKAEGVEQTLQDSMQQRLQDLDESSQ